MYVVISIGNSDDRLTQQQWTYFVYEMDAKIRSSGKVHFMGGPHSYARWQNLAWLVEIGQDDIPQLKEDVKKIRQKYYQDSAFFMEGLGEFV